MAEGCHKARIPASQSICMRELPKPFRTLQERGLSRFEGPSGQVSKVLPLGPLKRESSHGCPRPNRKVPACSRYGGSPFRQDLPLCMFRSTACKEGTHLRGASLNQQLCHTQLAQAACRAVLVVSETSTRRTTTLTPVYAVALRKRIASPSRWLCTSTRRFSAREGEKTRRLRHSAAL